MSSVNSVSTWIFQKFKLFAIAAELFPTVISKGNMRDTYCVSIKSYTPSLRYIFLGLSDSQKEWIAPGMSPPLFTTIGKFDHRIICELSFRYSVPPNGQLSFMFPRERASVDCKMSLSCPLVENLQIYYLLLIIEKISTCFFYHSIRNLVFEYLNISMFKCEKLELKFFFYFCFICV